LKFTLIILLLFVPPFYSQNKISPIDTTKNQPTKETLRQIKINKPIDRNWIHPIIELKTLIIPKYNEMYETRDFWNIASAEYFTKEEISSGLSKNELIAYKKNKELLFSILQQKYDGTWYYHVKSLGQLIGVPDLAIKILQFGLLLL
jgi:hypothetical protein